MLAQIISLGVRRISNSPGRLSEDFLLKKLVRFDFVRCMILYFPEKGCHLGTNRSDNET